MFEEILETNFKGSVYHPNLCSFDINLENGLEQRREKFLPAFTGEFRNSYLNRFHIQSLFLKQKPYAFSLLADKSRRIENREFFERQVIDSTTYGANFGYRNKFIPVNLSLRKNSRNIDRASRPSQDYKDDEINLTLSNESRITGNTRLDFTFDRFSRIESDIADQKGDASDLSLFNEKPLFNDNKKLLSSFLRFYNLSGTRDSSNLNLNERLDIEHTDYLNSSYSYNFSSRSSEGAKTKDNRLGANLRHRLYESLNSSFNVYYFNSDSSSFSQDSYGLFWDEDYVKKIGKLGKLSLGAGLNYSQEQRQTFGSIISIIDESHTLTTAVVTLLDYPLVNTATVVVTDAITNATYVMNTDYQLIAVGERTQIQSITIPNNTAVLVDYTAGSSPSFRFNTLGDNYRFRMDFLEELIGIFYRLSRERHPNKSGEENAILQTLTANVYGMDLHYKNLDIGLENEDYDSNLSPYKKLSLKESFFFNPTRKSTLTFQASQSKIRLVNTQQSQRFFDFISRLSIGLNRYTRLNTELGFRWQRGAGIDLDNLTSRSNLEFSFGKFTLDMEYDFTKELFLGDRLKNHFFFTKIKRTF